MSTGGTNKSAKHYTLVLQRLREEEPAGKTKATIGEVKLYQGDLNYNKTKGCYETEDGVQTQLSSLKSVKYTVTEQKQVDQRFVGINVKISDDGSGNAFSCYSCERKGPSSDRDIDGDWRRIKARKYRLCWRKPGNQKFVTNQLADKQELKDKVLLLDCEDDVNLQLGQNDKIGGARLNIQKTPEKYKFASRFICIHNGNYSSDVQGCILIGDYPKGKTNAGCVENSIKTVLTLESICEKIGTTSELQYNFPYTWRSDKVLYNKDVVQWIDNITLLVVDAAGMKEEAD